MNLNGFKNKNIHVVGISGVEGSSLALFLISLGCQKLIGHDFSLNSQFIKNYHHYHQDLSLKVVNQQIQKIKKKFKKINYQQSYLKDIDKAEIIFATSSWFRYKANQPLRKLKKIQLFWNWYNLLLEFYQGTLIGVTGTAGKGTTTHLTYLILQTAGKKVWLVGDSWQNLDLYSIIQAPANSFVVAELSNRTLTFAKNSKISPPIAIITNISKHHLDDHNNSFIKYISVKKEIAKYQQPSNFLLLNSQDKLTKSLRTFNRARKIIFSYHSSEKSWINNKNIIGNHLISDAVAAIKVARLLKISKKNILKGLNKFNAREGRMQFIKKINNITFINDGASTRPQATIEAIKSFPKNKVNLILEGSRLSPNYSFYSELIKTIKKWRVKNIAISGTITKFLYPYLLKTKLKIIKAINLQDSIISLYNIAKTREIILLSPANESFGEFTDYRERINKFNQIINNLNV